MGELDDLDEEGIEAAKIYIQQLKGMIDDSKKKALKEKQANNIELAKKHLAEMKKHQAQLEEQYELYPKLKEQPPQQAEVPQKVEKPVQPVIKKQEPPKASVPSIDLVPQLNIGGDSGEDDIEMEETVHDYDKMVAISVIQAEIEIMDKLVKTTKDSEKREFYKDKHSNLEFSMSTIMGNIDCGIMTEAKYMSNIKKYLQE